jgi:L-threonylcarbamoyladenylate synthase
MYIGSIQDLLQEIKGEVSVLSFQDSYPNYRNIRLSETGDLKEAARNLFSAMRMLDADPGHVIIGEWVPDVGLGRAINDRLRRAAAKSER